MPSAARAPCPALAIVTGAGSANGIGFATARRLALAGHEVLLAGLSDRVHERAAEHIAGGHRAHAFAGDLADEAAVRALAAQAQSTGLPVAALVNNAGMAVAVRVEDGVLQDLAHAAVRRREGLIDRCREQRRVGAEDAREVGQIRVADGLVEGDAYVAVVEGAEVDPGGDGPAQTADRAFPAPSAQDR